MFIYDKLIEKIKTNEDIINIKTLIEEETNRNCMDKLEENDPHNNDSIGALISKLACVTTQMWENQEILYHIRSITTNEFIEKYGNDLKKLHLIVKRCCDLNVQRSNLMDAIDRKLSNINQGG